MNNKFRRKQLFTTILLLLLTISLSAPLLSNAYAAEQTPTEKTQVILNNVLNLDLPKYTQTSKEQPQNETTPYLGVIPQENVEYILRSDQNWIDVLCTFTNGNLQMLHVFENKGTPKTTKEAPASNIDGAKNFLGNYQTYTNNPFYGELVSTLDGVDEGKNVTKTYENTQLEVSVIDGYTTLKWTYQFNGVLAPSKFVALGFNNSFIEAFVDNWQLYKIGSTTVNLQENQAKADAMDTAKAYNWSLKLDEDTFDVAKFNESNVVWTALIFDCSVGAENIRGDALTLYPVWRVGVQLDKWYGNMYGLEVDIWADTKEVRYVQEAWSTMSPLDEESTASSATISEAGSQASALFGANQSLITWITILSITTISGTTLLYLGVRRKSRIQRLPKPYFTKSFGILFCVLMLSVMLFTPTQTATGAGAATVWGSESAGAFGYPDNSSWRKSNLEIALQEIISPAIASYFAANGYNATNHQGSNCNKTDILNDIVDMQYYNDYAVAIDFDHGIGRSDYDKAEGEFHYMFEDNMGTIWGTYDQQVNHTECGVYDMDVYNVTNPGEVAFVFANTCLSADTSITQGGLNSTQGIVNPSDPQNEWRARGMPFAWTHRLVEDKTTQGFNIDEHIGDDGYGDPDDGSQCYIGFPWGSASLEQRIPFSTGYSYFDWVNYFFFYATYFDMSVNMALDHATWQYNGTRFINNALHTGFQAYWWSPTGGLWPDADSTMVVYGNGNIHLHNYTPGWYDNFDDNSRDTNKWDALQTTGASVSETNSRLEVTVDSGGSGYAQAGYVTTSAFNMQNQKATVQIPEFNDLLEMTLMIGNSKVTSSDPYSNVGSWYRILKLSYDSNVYIQRRISGGSVSTKAILPWSGATGSLTIQVANGAIAFYENDNLKYAEPYELPSYNCYTYVFTSTERPYWTGTDAFDNFALSPTTAFKDDFNDENTYMWTGYSGTWYVENSKLKGQGTYSPFYSNQTFPSNRVVQSKMQTVQAGGTPYDVAVLMINWVDSSNQITTRLFTDGTLELFMWEGGTNVAGDSCNITLSPSVERTFTAAVVGTNIKVYVDGTLYINKEDNHFDDLSGAVGYQTSSSCYFDDMTVYH